MSNYGNRRQESRRKVLSFTLVHDLKTGTLLGYLNDLTLNGAGVTGKKELATGTECTLSIELPDDISRENLVIDAALKRCVEVDEDPVGYNLGFEFLSPEAEKLAIIEKLLERFVFKKE